MILHWEGCAQNDRRKRDIARAFVISTVVEKSLTVSLLATLATMRDVSTSLDMTKRNCRRTLTLGASNPEVRLKVRIPVRFDLNGATY
jgi:hypothetical protein